MYKLSKYDKIGILKEDKECYRCGEIIKKDSKFYKLYYTEEMCKKCFIKEMV